MELGLTNKIMGDLRDLSFAADDKNSVVSFLVQLQQWRGTLDAVEINAARRLHELSINAPADLAAATQRHVRSGNTVFERAATLAAVGSLLEPLQAGTIHGAHVDTVAKVARTVRDEHAEQFSAVLPRLIEEAVSGRLNPDELARTLTKAARALENDDGVSRFEQQRRETALRMWTDKRNGMFRFSGSLDPLSGALLNGRLNAAMAALFSEKTPSTCPTDPGLKQDHLRALALLCLTASGRRDLIDEPDADPNDEWSTFIRNGPSRFGRPEIVVVLDARAASVEANNSRPVVDWGIPVELPARTLEELFPRADVHPVIVLNGVVLHAPGELHLGRTTRLANRAQRRALRALYATCAVYGCAVKFDHCQPHHVKYWENGGFTDLDNLLPLCSRHHHLVHEGGWKLTLGLDRTVTVIYPDGSIQTTGPPLVRQAA
jgi:hypothetical protein